MSKPSKTSARRHISVRIDLSHTGYQAERVKVFSELLRVAPRLTEGWQGQEDREDFPLKTPPRSANRDPSS